MSHLRRIHLAIAVAALAPSAAIAVEDAFLCYRTRPSAAGGAFTATTVAVTDLDGARSIDLRRSRTLCAPVDLGDGVDDPDTFLRGYRSRLNRGEEKYDTERGVSVSDQFGTQLVDTKRRPKRILVPTAVGPSSPPPDPNSHAVDHYRCHKAKPGSDAVPPAAGQQVTLSDAFTTAKTFDLIKPTDLCVPVDVDGVAVEDPASSLQCYRVRRAKGEPRHTRVTALETNNAIGPATLDTAREVELCVPSRAIARCNGFSDLCDRGFDEVAHPTTHNAMSNAEEGWLGPNQNLSITHQLEDGVRGLMLDSWYFGPQTVLCHGGDIVPCDVAGMKPLADGLAEITDFLDTHPDEVVSIIFESYITEADTETAFVAADLLRYVHVQPAATAWPTLRELLEADTRLVVLTDDGGASLPWHHYVWAHAWETHFSFQAPGDFSCDINRGSMSNQLFILNHFLTNFIGSPALANMVNHNPLFVDRAQQCQSESGRLPNFVTVDFHDIGDLFAVVDVLNGVAE